MAVQIVKSAVKTLGRRLGLLAGVPNGKSTECGPGWYDQAYARTDSYHCHYSQSWYYFLWMVIADRIRRAGLRRIVDIGCGTGQLGALMLDQGIERYVGLDFSPNAIAIARRSLPGGDRSHVLVGDARTSDVYSAEPYDALICTEVLEHVEADLEVISHFPIGIRCFCSVPNFPYESHVRHFTSVGEVEQRYGRFFQDLDVMAIRGPKSAAQVFYLIDGIRNRVTV